MLIKVSIFECKKAQTDYRDFWRDQVNSGALDTLAAIKTLVTIRLLYPFNTACCERGFSRMKMIKCALRNRLYIETLDALMLIFLLGPRLVGEDLDKSTLFDDALKDWSKQCMRTPNRAVFGNSNAKKKTIEVRTELPSEQDSDHEHDDDTQGGLDSVADEDEINEVRSPASNISS